MSYNLQKTHDEMIYGGIKTPTMNANTIAELMRVGAKTFRVAYKIERRAISRMLT